MPKDVLKIKRPQLNVSGDGSRGRWVEMTPEMEQWLRDMVAEKASDMSARLDQYNQAASILQNTVNVAAYFGLDIDLAGLDIEIESEDEVG